MPTDLVTYADPNRNIEKTDKITKEMLCGALPDKRLRNGVTDELIDLINSEPDSEMRRVYRDNVLSFSSVLMKGRYSLTAYIHAVKFVSLKLLGDESSTAYAKVFPERYQKLVAKGTSSSQIACFADNYAKNKLVIQIMEQTMVPTHILNAGIYQEAINVQAELMRTAKSDMVKQRAAECLITNLKAPEIARMEIDVAYSNNVIDDLRATTRALAAQQKTLIEAGYSNAHDIAQSDIFIKQQQVDEAEIIDVEAAEVTEDEDEEDSSVPYTPPKLFGGA